MAFLLDRFDIVKQYADGTGLYAYHDTVGAHKDPSTNVEGDLMEAIKTEGFFNPVAKELGVPGALILVTATDGAALFRVTKVYNLDKPQVTVEEAKLPGA